MKSLKCRIAFFDIDGTLTINNNIIPQSALRALDELRNAGCRIVLYNLDLMYESDDYNPPRERVRARMEEILRHADSGTAGAVYVSQYPRDVTGVMPVVPYPMWLAVWQP